LDDRRLLDEGKFFDEGFFFFFFLAEGKLLQGGFLKGKELLKRG
jgi:hypothetical protein